jgi:hypothetical protein
MKEKKDSVVTERVLLYLTLEAQKREKGGKKEEVT